MGAAQSTPPAAAPLVEESTPLVEESTKPVYLCFRTRLGAAFFIMGLMFFTVGIKQASNDDLPVSLPALRQLGLDTSLLPGIFAAFYGVGKVSQLFLTYFFGPRLVLILSMVLSSMGGVCICSTEQSLVMFGTAITAYGNAHVYGTVLRVLAQWSSLDHLGRTIGISIGLANDFGSIAATVIFSLLQANIPAPNPLHATAPYLLTTGLTLMNAFILIACMRESATAAGFPPPRQVATKTRGDSSTGGSSKGDGGKGDDDKGGSGTGGSGSSSGPPSPSSTTRR